jgi:hypothetical protein
MTTLLTVLDPTADVADAVVGPLVEPPASLAGLAIGVLDNGKSNSDEFLARLGRRLVEKGATIDERIRKPGVGSLAPQDQVDRLIASSDLVVTGVGDCAGCCSCSVQDAIAIERRGVPAVLICTSEMVTTGRIAAAAAGVPDFPFVVVEHPVASCTDAELDGRVDRALAQILERIPA